MFEKNLTNSFFNEPYSGTNIAARINDPYTSIKVLSELMAAHGEILLAFLKILKES